MVQVVLLNTTKTDVFYKVYEQNNKELVVF